MSSATTGRREQQPISGNNSASDSEESLRCPPGTATSSDTSDDSESDNGVENKKKMIQKIGGEDDDGGDSGVGAGRSRRDIGEEEEEGNDEIRTWRSSSKRSSNRSDPRRRFLFPPIHTTLCLVVVTCLCVTCLPTLESIDAVANAETLLRQQRRAASSSTTTSASILSLRHVAWIRLLFGLIMLCDIFFVVLFAQWERSTSYYEGSRLVPVPRIEFRGAFAVRPRSLRRGIGLLSAFTRCCWAVECAAFLLLGIIPLVLLYKNSSTAYVDDSNDVHGNVIHPVRIRDDPIPQWTYRLAVLAWEIAAPASLLVSTVVKYVLWPVAMNDDNNRKLIKHPSLLLEHNFNSVACLVEIGLLGGMPVRLQHWPFVVLFGVAYVVFTYWMQNRWPCGNDAGPQFMYPFLDPTLPGLKPTMSLLGLLFALALSYAILSCTDSYYSARASGAAGLSTRFVAVSLLSAAVCRFRD